MKLNNMNKEELELYTYTDIAEMILMESKKPLSTVEIFKKICELLTLSEEQYKEKIGTFYTSLTTDKRFISLDNAEWDLRDRHAVKIVLEDDEEDDDEIDEDEVEEEVEEEIEEDDEEIIDDDLDDDMDDLSIISEEDMEDE